MSIDMLLSEPETFLMRVTETKDPLAVEDWEVDFEFPFYVSFGAEENGSLRILNVSTDDLGPDSIEVNDPGVFLVRTTNQCH